jgi:hypothetical protein
MSRKLARTSRRNGFEEYGFQTEESTSFDVKKSDPDYLWVA